MKNIFNYIGAVFALLITFVVVSSMAGPLAAGVVTFGLVAYSLASKAGAFKGALFNGPPELPDFTEKSFEDISALSKEDLYSYRKEENDWHAAKTELAIYEATEKLREELKAEDITPEVKTKLEETIAAYESKHEVLRKENIRFGLEIKALSEKGGKFMDQATEACKELSDNMDAIKGFAHGSGGELEIKALTLRANITGNESAVDLTTVGTYGRPTLSMFDLFPKINLANGQNDGTVRYYDWDEATTVEAAEMVAEGAAFPESTAKWQKYSIDLKKIGDTLPVTEEFFEDETMFAAELRMFLMRNVEDIIDYQLAKGAGTGENLTGLQTSATAFTPATVTHYDTPNIFDLLTAMKEQVHVARGSKYRLNFVAMNTATRNKMFGTKDSDKNYLSHPLMSPDRTNFDGMTIVEANILDNDVIIVGDNRYGVIYHKPGIVLSRGFVGDQFKEDEITLKVRKRLLLLIRNVDTSAFVKVTDTDAALAAIDITS